MRRPAGNASGGPSVFDVKDQSLDYWSWDAVAQGYERRYRGPARAVAIRVVKQGSLDPTSGWSKDGPPFVLRWEVYDPSGVLLHHSKVVVEPGGTWGEAMSEALVRYEILTNQILPEVERDAGIPNARIRNYLRLQYDTIRQRQVDAATRDWMLGGMLGAVALDHPGVTPVTPPSSIPFVPTPTPESKMSKSATDSDFFAETTKPSSGSIVLEGLEMGAISAVIEVGARRLLAKAGGDPENAVALHSAKVGIVLLLKHVGMPMLGDTLPEGKQEFVDRRLEIALKGVTATASYQAVGELSALLGPLLEMLTGETAALVKMLGAGMPDMDSVPVREPVRTGTVHG